MGVFPNRGWRLRRDASRPEVVVRIAIALARFADGATGRNCAAANATIRRDGRILGKPGDPGAQQAARPAGLAVEACRGKRWGTARRASVWHLIPSSAVAQPAVSDLPPPSGRWVISSRDQSPRAQARKSPLEDRPSAGGGKHPRPLAVRTGRRAHRAAASAWSRCIRAQVCDALSQSGLDLAHWSAGQLTPLALDADMRQRGINWPDRISRRGHSWPSGCADCPPAQGDRRSHPARPGMTHVLAAGCQFRVRRAALDQIRSQVAAAPPSGVLGCKPFNPQHNWEKSDE